jgi:hypothetical protein
MMMQNSLLEWYGSVLVQVQYASRYVGRTQFVRLKSPSRPVLASPFETNPLSSFWFYVIWPKRTIDSHRRLAGGSLKSPPEARFRNYGIPPPSRACCSMFGRLCVSGMVAFFLVCWWKVADHKIDDPVFTDNHFLFTQYQKIKQIQIK